MEQITPGSARLREAHAEAARLSPGLRRAFLAETRVVAERGGGETRHLDTAGLHSHTIAALAKRGYVRPHAAPTFTTWLPLTGKGQHVWAAIAEPEKYGLTMGETGGPVHPLAMPEEDKLDFARRTNPSVRAYLAQSPDASGFLTRAHGNVVAAARRKGYVTGGAPDQAARLTELGAAMRDFFATGQAPAYDRTLKAVPGE